MEENKNEGTKIELEEADLKEVAGGGCWFGARFVAPDGHDVGCAESWYRVQYGGSEFARKFPSICEVDGGPHDPSGREYRKHVGYIILCAKCGRFLDRNGNYIEGYGVTVE